MTSLVHFAAFEVDLATGELRKSGHTVKLQPQPFKILALLLERQGELVTREEIRQKLWGDDTFVDFEQGLNFAIKKIRAALGDDADRPRYIETLPRRGYRFIAPVEWVSAAEPRETSQQPVTTPQGRVVSISEGLKASPEGSRPDGAGAGALAEVAPPDLEVPPTPVPAIAPIPAGRSSVLRRLLRWRALAIVAVVVLAAAGAYFYLHSRTGLKLTDKDTIVIADFANATGDPVFDGTLRQGLAADLEQSPYLNIASDESVSATLRMMEQQVGARLTPDLAREVCQRDGGKAVLDGSIASLGRQYVLGLTVLDCATGDILAQTQTEAASKEQVLNALGRGAQEIRGKLGETVSSIQKFNAPIKQVTTPSLEALQAYNLGLKTMIEKRDFGTAMVFFQRAVSLDPNFAVAYDSLGVCYANRGQSSLATANLKKAYDLSDRVSEREKFEIVGVYDAVATGNLLKAKPTLQLRAATYPRDLAPRTDLGNAYLEMGRYEDALAEYLEDLRFHPDSVSDLASLMALYTNLNRFDEARATYNQAMARKMDSAALHFNLYNLAFLQNDAAGMAQQVAWAAGKPGIEMGMLANEADTEAYYGRLEKARQLSRGAAQSALSGGDKESAAAIEVDAALREALFGNAVQARRGTAASLTLSSERDVEVTAAVALSLSDDATRADALADALAKRYPEDTVVNFNYLPEMRGSIALDHGNAIGAIELLDAARPYELGSPIAMVSLAGYPVYVRGLAYLAARQGAEAAVEFQKILDHTGVVGNEPIGALAHLGLGRAYAFEAGVPVAAASSPPRGSQPTSRAAVTTPPLQPEALAKARIAYQDFLALWKDADPDIPILKQAKAEYAKLR